jgi:hypothetical protein
MQFMSYLYNIYYKYKIEYIISIYIYVNYAYYKYIYSI